MISNSKLIIYPCKSLNQLLGFYKPYNINKTKSLLRLYIQYSYNNNIYSIILNDQIDKKVIIPN